ncbi:MAG TPA: hypothetical protein VGK44_17010 [Casimicrobiaceae bacterium]|jgi:hypothetical protein
MEIHAARWLAPEWIMLPLGVRRCRVRNPLNGATAELSAEQYAVLTACEGCRTLDEHAAAVHRKLALRDDDRVTLSQWVGEFAALGLLASLDQLRQRLDANASSAPASFAGIVIRTCDRSALLARVLASAAALEARLDRRYRYHVLDDSRDGGHRAENARIVAAAGLDAHYRDLSSSDPFVAELARAFPASREAIDWLLGPARDGEATYGRPVNLALLLSAGQRILMLDDDALLDPRRPPVDDARFSVSSRPDELFCYIDRADAERACTPIDVDPFAEHLRWLGTPVGATWSHFAPRGAAADRVELRAEDGGRFIADARIALTQNHALGDPGSALFPFHLLTLPTASRQHLLSDSRRKAAAFRERVNWRGQIGTRLTPNRTLTLTTLAGLDNGRLLPPTVRSARNEDLLLGEMTRVIDRGAWSLDLPWALPHWRSPIKNWLGPSAHFSQEPAHFLMDYLDQTSPRVASEGASNRLHALAAILVDLAHASESRLIELLEEQAVDTASRVQFAIATAQDGADVPLEWKEMLRPWIASPTLSTRPAIVRERLAAPAVVRALANDYGNALAVWPALWDWARDRSPLA